MAETTTALVERKGWVNVSNEIHFISTNLKNSKDGFISKVCDKAAGKTGVLLDEVMFRLNMIGFYSRMEC